MKTEDNRNKVLIKAILVIVIMFILFLFALNGRYHSLGDGYVLDKWKKEVIHYGTRELPVKINGEKVFNGS